MKRTLTTGLGILILSASTYALAQDRGSRGWDDGRNKVTSVRGETVRSEAPPAREQQRSQGRASPQESWGGRSGGYQTQAREQNDRSDRGSDRRQERFQDSGREAQRQQPQWEVQQTSSDYRSGGNRDRGLPSRHQGHDYSNQGYRNQGYRNQGYRDYGHSDRSYYRDRSRSHAPHWRSVEWRRSWHHGWSGNRYTAPARYYYPRGFSYRSWSIGYRLPAAFYVPTYYVDYRGYGLAVPPYGTEWVRVDADLLLVDIITGEIIDILRRFYY